MFKTDDVHRMKQLGLTPRIVKKHLELYAQGPKYLTLLRPCTLGDGLQSPSPARRRKLVDLYTREAPKNRIIKFVPASGAASRMFASWFAALDRGGVADEKAFWRTLTKMPFYERILDDPRGRKALDYRNSLETLEYILMPSGLNYGMLPKALIFFHGYSHLPARLAIEEHLVEGARLLSDRQGICRLHFTVSKEHVRLVKRELKRVVPIYEQRFNVRFGIALSVQSPTTSRMAVDEHLQPFRDETGCLVFRPGGHGALIDNLGSLNADLIFVKNIDNIVCEDRLLRLLPYKQMLGGLALEIRKSVFLMLRLIEAKKVDHDMIEQIKTFCQRTLSAEMGPRFEASSIAQKRKIIFNQLYRPLRVCGMVKNEGEPGGGPFWVNSPDGVQTLQIVESAHVDQRDPKQAAIWTQASYFNPVDMVCCIKDHHGKRFDLSRFVDPNAYLISHKTEKGRNLLASELPGLWNGSMAGWNTVFVELPLAVFNPVKTVDDLMRPQHRAAKGWKPL